jgi:hypothetical protein
MRSRQKMPNIQSMLHLTMLQKLLMKEHTLRSAKEVLLNFVRSLTMLSLTKFIEQIIEDYNI